MKAPICQSKMDAERENILPVLDFTGSTLTVHNMMRRHLHLLYTTTSLLVLKYRNLKYHDLTSFLNLF